MAVPYKDITPESIKQEILQKISGTVETREGSYANTLLSPGAFQIWLTYQLGDQVRSMAFPDENSGEYIDKRASDFGVTRIPGKKAQVALRFTAYSGSSSVTIPAGTVACTRDGLRFLTTEAAVLSGGTVDIAATAEEIGRIYNVDADTITVMARNVSGIASVTNPAAAYGGTDDETDREFLARFHEFLRRPISSGNKNHYIMWAKEVPGVVNAECEAIWAGPGTVKVIVGGPDKDPVDASVVAAAAVHIEEERPIGPEVTVVSVENLEISVAATVTLVTGATAAQVQEELAEALSAMLLEFSFGKPKLIRSSRVLALLLNCRGVEEYHAYTVNGGAANISATAEQTPVVGSVTITVQGG